jgi:hypothetical protein
MPPLPPVATPVVTLRASPVVPETAEASEDAPELAELLAWPSLAAGPVSPLGAAVVGGVCATVAGGAAAGVELGMVGVVWATAAPPQNTRMVAISAPTEADTLEIIRVPGLPVFMLNPLSVGPASALSVLEEPCRRPRRTLAGTEEPPTGGCRCVTGEV